MKIKFFTTYNIVIVLLFLSVLGVLSSGVLPYTEAVYPLCLLFFFITVWIIFTFRYISFDLFNLYTLFTLSAIIFNGGQLLLEVFHFNQTGILNGAFSNETIIRTLCLVIISLLSFHFGGLICASFNNKSKAQFFTKESHAISYKLMRRIGFVLCAFSSIPFFMLTGDAIKIVLHGGYFALYQQNIVTGLDAGMSGIKLIVAHFFVPGVFFLLVGNTNNAGRQYLLFSILFLYFLILMFLGFRGHGAMLFMALLWIWHKIMRPLPFGLLCLCGALLLFVIFPVITLTRNTAGIQRMDMDYFVDTFLLIDNPAITTIRGMGESMNTISYTLELIPQERPFAMGLTYIYATSSIIPNLFWNLHPAVRYGNMGRWLTMTVDPQKFYKGGGMGYSFIAEAYANFGWLGSAIFLALVGFYMAKITRWGDVHQTSGNIVVVAGCIASILQWARGDITIFYRPVVIYVLLPYLLFIFLRKKAFRKVHQ